MIVDATQYSMLSLSLKTKTARDIVTFVRHCLFRWLWWNQASMQAMSIEMKDFVVPRDVAALVITKSMLWETFACISTPHWMTSFGVTNRPKAITKVISSNQPNLIRKNLPQDMNANSSLSKSAPLCTFKSYKIFAIAIYRRSSLAQPWYLNENSIICFLHELTSSIDFCSHGIENIKVRERER